jgi:predicted outer membrane protein
MWKSQHCRCAVIAVLALAACATDRNERVENLARAAGEKVAFIDQLARFDESQIVLARLALERSDNPAIKDFAQRLFEQHARHLTTLAEWSQARTGELAVVARMDQGQGIGGAGTAGLEPGIDELAEKIGQYAERAVKEDVKKLEKFSELSQLSGQQFDRKFLEMARREQQEGHRRIEKGQDEYKGDVVFATLLAKTEPVLEQHVQEAEKLKKGLE